MDTNYSSVLATIKAAVKEHKANLNPAPSQQNRGEVSGESSFNRVITDLISLRIRTCNHVAILRTAVVDLPATKLLNNGR